MVSRMTSPTATARSFQKSPSMSCSCSVRFVICYCLCCGLTDMRQSSTTASHTSDTTAVTAYSTAIKANTFHMVCSCLRNSESVLGPYGGVAHCAYFSRLFNQSTNTSTSFGLGGINMVYPFICRSKVALGDGIKHWPLALVTHPQLLVGQITANFIVWVQSQ